MQAEQRLSFGPYRLDSAHGQLWRGKQAVKLTPKALAVLRHLMERPSQVVTKEELFQAAWPDTVVSDAALTYCIRELRHALRDDARTPRYIETVHRRGFRFIGKVVSDQLSVVSPPLAALPRSQLATGNWQLTTRLVGREEELRQLYNWLDKALNGERQLIFVTGEPGIGKTTLVEAFLAQMAGEGTVGLGQGQCIEHYGAGEAYLPLLEALGRLCREREGQQVRAILEQYAPTWLVQMPSLLTNEALEALQRKVAGATKERMLRELAEALEALSAERAVILCVEDLQWSDYSTLDAFTLLGRRHDLARLLVLGTYRPVDVLMREHPLQGVTRELQLHGHCQELVLDFLREEDVSEYLMRRFHIVPFPLVGEGQDGGALRQELSRRPPHPSPLPQGERETVQHAAPLQKLAQLIHQRTDGNPLFMVNLVDHLLSQGVLVQVDGQWTLKREGEAAAVVPESLRQMIEQRLAQVGAAERVVLEVASVAGAEFSAAAVAAGVGTAVEAVEEQCAELARQELFLRASGAADWPDGTRATRYGFLHALYQEVLYERLTAGRRQRLHRRIGERKETAYGERAGEIATELAVHFEQGQEYGKAVQYHQRAAERATQRSAYQEAIRHPRPWRGATTRSASPKSLLTPLSWRRPRS